MAASTSLRLRNRSKLIALLDSFSFPERLPIVSRASIRLELSSSTADCRANPPLICYSSEVQSAAVVTGEVTTGRGIFELDLQFLMCRRHDIPPIGRQLCALYGLSEQSPARPKIAVRPTAAKRQRARSFRSFGTLFRSLKLKFVQLRKDRHRAVCRGNLKREISPSGASTIPCNLGAGGAVSDSEWCAARATGTGGRLQSSGPLPRGGRGYRPCRSCCRPSVRRSARGGREPDPEIAPGLCSA